MANTYTQLYIQIVFAVSQRKKLIDKKYNASIQKYITGIIHNKGHKLISINNMPDHFHIFIGYKPSEALSSLVRDIKANTSKYINEQRWFKGKFTWQKGYGAFSYSHSHINRVCKYIANQEKHHKKRSFRMEYKNLLEHFNIDYNQKYLFNFVKE